MVWKSTIATAQNPAWFITSSSQRGTAQNPCWKLCRKRKPTPSTESVPRAMFQKSSRLGGGQSSPHPNTHTHRGTGWSCEGENHRFINIPILDVGKMQGESGAGRSSLQCKFKQVTSHLWVRGLECGPLQHSRTLFLESLGNKLTLQSHNFHLHYCSLG